VLFVAPTAWPPNAAAIDWLLDLGVPQALDRLGYELRLVGRGTERFGSRPGLSCGGFVDDLGEEYAAARLVLCPIWSGSGANIKLGEAIQFGRAVLATRHSAQAYDGFLRANEELLIFDQPSEFMDVLVDISQDSSRLRALEIRASEAASKFLNQSYVNRIIAEDVATLTHHS
jgi:Glycosyl transferases group 1